jgi:hypothetical protein
LDLKYSVVRKFDRFANDALFCHDISLAAVRYTSRERFPVDKSPDIGLGNQRGFSIGCKKPVSTSAELSLFKGTLRAAQMQLSREGLRRCSRFRGSKR